MGWIWILFNPKKNVISNLKTIPTKHSTYVKVKRVPTFSNKALMSQPNVVAVIHRWATQASRTFLLRVVIKKFRRVIKADRAR